MKHPGLSIPVLSLAALVLVGGALAAYYLVGESTLTPEETTRLLELKNTGIGYLEAGDYSDSDSVFTNILEQAPKDALGARNLLITRVLALKENTLANPSQGISAAHEALAHLIKLEPDSVATHLLASRLAQAEGNTTKAVDALSKSVVLSPQDAGLWYELNTIGRDNDKFRGQALDALERAIELAPNNLAVLSDWLLMKIESKDASIVPKLESALDILKPFSSSIQAHTGADLSTLLGEAITGAKSSEWPVVNARVRMITNVLRPEVAVRLDRKRLIRHELEYVMFDYAPGLIDEGTNSDRSPPIAVKLIEAPAQDQLPAMTDVRAAKLADFDLDGSIDVLIARGQRLEIYARDDRGWSLITDRELPFVPAGLMTADLDRDADPSQTAQQASACGIADLDIIVWGASGLLVLENIYDAGSNSRALTPRAQSVDFEGLRQVLSAAVVDLDHDGDLDLAVSTEAGLSLWSNRGDFTFANISARSALPPETLRASTIIPVDWNRTIDIDVVLAGTSSTGAGWLENHRHGRLRWLSAGFEALAGKSVALGDFDANVSWDFVAAGEQGLEILLTQTPDEAVVRTTTTRQITDTALDGVTTWDFDNDGHIDLLAWGKNGLSAWRGGPGAAFESVGDLFTDFGETVHSAQIADIDGDGDEDVLALNDSGLTWFNNEGGNTNHWLDINLSGQLNADQKDERVNMYGVGSLLEVKAGSLYQARVVNGPQTHFGLGARDSADVARVLWTNGIPQAQIKPSADAMICEVQILKGSCPYLYAWNGTNFGFVTDLLWASPIGLQLAENVIAPARNWEYLKIPAEQLVAVGDEYQLRITEELWETAYFDHVQLIAVDHREDVDIYSNEKVGPAAIAEFQIHTTSNPRVPKAAHDQTGRDVLDIIAKRDDRYLKSFQGRLVQGLVDDHYLEVDLGELVDPERVVLFLTGWVFPSDTSLNIAISQDPTLQAPRPPSLWVPDRDGQWQQVQPYMGFPGGKTKTIAIDLSDTFLTDDYRVRVATSMEIYWDHVFFSVDEEPADIQLTELELLSANLSRRGFSKRIEHSENGPESYLYEQTNPMKQWPVTQGQLTGYGDVYQRLVEADDRLVVMGAGDDLALRFKALSEPASGWKRDFILHNIGWDKDADLNTVYGDTVEPLPYIDMAAYTDPITHASREVPEESALTPARNAKARDFIRWVKQFESR